MKTDLISPYGGRVHKTLKNTGYWELSWWNPATKHIESQREHRYVWEHGIGPIPIDFVIHHRDGNKCNNSLGNLELVHISRHKSFHTDGHTLNRALHQRKQRQLHPERYRAYDRAKYERIKADPIRWAALLAYRNLRYQLRTKQKRSLVA